MAAPNGLYEQDVLISWVVRVCIYVAFAALLAVLAAGCSRSTPTLSDQSPFLGDGQYDKTWNQQPHGGIDEKSNRAPSRGPC